MLTQPVPLCHHFVATDERCLHTGAWRPRQKLCQPFGLYRHVRACTSAISPKSHRVARSGELAD